MNDPQAPIEEAKKFGTLRPFDPSGMDVIRSDRSRRALTNLAASRRRATVRSRSTTQDVSSSESDRDDVDEDFTYETDDAHLRRSRRKPGQIILPFSPVKKRVPEPTRRSSRAKKTSFGQNYDSEDDYQLEEDDSDDDYGTTNSIKAKKPRRKRASRPTYGFVRSTDDLGGSESESNPLKAHRKTCEKCFEAPAHATRKKKGLRTGQ